MIRVKSSFSVNNSYSPIPCVLNGNRRLLRAGPSQARGYLDQSFGGGGDVPFARKIGAHNSVNYVEYQGHNSANRKKIWVLILGPNDALKNN